jgi:dTMP kinase
MASRGKLIVFEGIDGSGKATQADLLVKYLRKTGKKAIKIEFPRYNKESSVLIREYLAGKFGKAEEVGPYRGSVFYAIDRYAESFRIRRYLNRGYYVIADRYVSSNKGHQAAKLTDKRERMKFLVWVNQFEYEIMGIPVPELTIFLHLPASIAYELVKARANGKKLDLLDKKKSLEKSEQTYLDMIAADPYENWVVIECAEGQKMLAKENIFTLITSALKKEKVL